MNAIKIAAIAAIAALGGSLAAAQTEDHAHTRTLAEAHRICSEQGQSSSACTEASRAVRATFRARSLKEGAAMSAAEAEKPRPQEGGQSVLNTLERLRAAQQQQQAPTARPNSAGAPAQGGSTQQGAGNLTAAERTGLADRIGECWSIDAGASGVQNIVVELRVEVDAGGTVRAVRPNGAIPTEPRARSVYEAARRALLNPRCNPLPLPPARLAALRDVVFLFNPRDLGLR